MASPLKTPSTKNWADEDSDEDDSVKEEFKRQFGSNTPPTALEQDKNAAPPPPAKEDAPVASLLSRISGLSTDQPSSSASSGERKNQPDQVHNVPTARGKPQTTNPLFGKALAGATRQSAQSSAPPPPASVSAPLAAPSGSPSVPTSSAAPTAPKAPATAAAPPLGSNQASGGSGKMTDELIDMNSNHGGSNGNAPQDNGALQVTEETMSDGSGALIPSSFQVEVKLKDQQADPNSPLYSIKEFQQLNLHDNLLKGIYAMGYTRPSKIQEKALPLLLMNPPQNLIGQSQSGTGKTAAFALTMLSRISPELQMPQAICLAPSRELARQIQEVITKLAQFTGVTTFLAVPRSWSRGVKIDKHILIGTPGTLMDMLSRSKGPQAVFDPKYIRMFVLDEADEMIAQQGLGEQTRTIQKYLPHNVQNVLFSATFPDEVRDFAQEVAPEANEIFLKKEEVTVDAIKQLYLDADGEGAKFDALSALYDCLTIGQSIVFCRKRATADEIAQRLINEGHSVASLHGEKQSDDRDQILDGFRNGKTKVLITTNVVARGIDIQQVNMVVNYDVPDLGPDGGFRPDIETYIHRIGRTGRFGRKGIAVTFSSDERSRRDVQDIMQQLGKPMKKIDVTRQMDIDALEVALKAALKGPSKE